MEKIIAWLETAKEKAGIKRINEFLYSNWFIVFLAGMTLVAYFFAIELYVYAIVAAIAIFISLFGRDYLPYLPAFIFCYIAPNPKNNAGQTSENIFSLQNGGIVILVMAALIILFFLFRLSIDKEINFKMLFSEKRGLTWGFIILFFGYILGGIGSKYFAQYAGKNFLFGSLEFLSAALPYFLLTGLVRWKKVDKRYFSYIGVAIGLVIGLELVYCYFSNGVITNGEIDNMKIFTGWGTSNNIGVLLVMSLPFAFYFIYQGEKVYLYTVAAILLGVFSVLTCSRATIACAGGVYLLCCMFVLIKSKNKKAKYVTIGGVICLTLVVLLVSFTRFDGIGEAFKIGIDLNGRFELYEWGIDVFKEDPIFGGTFYAMDEYLKDIPEKYWNRSGGLMPGRWHNTILQMLASCGIVGLATYAFHRYQTIRLFLKKLTAEKVFIGLSVGVLLLLSMIECHFFNIGPTLVYSCALAFVEGIEKQE